MKDMTRLKCYVRSSPESRHGSGTRDANIAEFLSALVEVGFSDLIPIFCV
jgi:hypothetical protein